MADKPDAVEQIQKPQVEQPVEATQPIEVSQPVETEALEQDSSKDITKDPIYQEAVKNLQSGMSSTERRMSGVFNSEDLEEEDVLLEMKRIKETSIEKEKAEQAAAKNQLELKYNKIKEKQKLYADMGYNKTLSEEEKDVVAGYEQLLNEEQNQKLVEPTQEYSEMVVQDMKKDIEGSQEQPKEAQQPQDAQQSPDQVTPEDIQNIKDQAQVKKQMLIDQVAQERADNEVENKFQDIVTSQIQQINDDVKELRNMQPTDFWQDKGSWSKVLAGIGMLMGGAPAVKIVNDAINQHAQNFANSREQKLELIAQGREMVNLHLDRLSKNIGNTEKMARIKQIKLENLKLQQEAISERAKQQARDSLIAQNMLTFDLLTDVEQKTTQELRKEYTKKLEKAGVEDSVGAFQDLSQLLNSGKELKGPDDIAIIFKFMKSLDPGSVVREGEFDRVAATVPLAQKINQFIEKARTGAVFPNDEFRRDFVSTIKQIAKGKVKTLNRLNNQYKVATQNFGLPKGSEKFIITEVDLSEIDPNINKSQRLKSGAKELLEKKGMKLSPEQEKKLNTILSR